MKTQHNVCVTHTQAWIPETLVDFTIGLGPHEPRVGASIAQLDAYWHQRRPVAFGAAGSYAIPRALEALGEAGDLIGVCTQRKIVTRLPLGVESPLIPPMREVELVEMASVGRDACRPVEPHDFLVAQPVVIGNLVAHYDKHHKVLDLIDYLSIAVEFGVLSSGDVAAFVTQSVLVTGGCELGVYPRRWLVDTLAKLERVGRQFLDRHAARVSRYDDYNVRALAFLSERLGSFMLLKELQRRYPAGIPRAVGGFICCAVEPGVPYAVARASAVRM